MSYQATYGYSTYIKNTCCARSGAAGSVPLKANFTLLKDTGSAITSGNVGRINKITVYQIHTWTSKPRTTKYWFSGTIFGNTITGSKNPSAQDSNDGHSHAIPCYYNNTLIPQSQTPISDINIHWGNFYSGADMYYRSFTSDNDARIRVIIDYDIISDIVPNNFTYTSSFNCPSNKNPIGGFHTATISCAQASDFTGETQVGFEYTVLNSQGTALTSSKAIGNIITIGNSYLPKATAGNLTVQITPYNDYGKGSTDTVTLSYYGLGGFFPDYSSSSSPFYDNNYNQIQYNNSISCFLATGKTNYIKIKGVGHAVNNQNYEYYFRAYYTVDGEAKNSVVASSSDYTALDCDWNNLVSLTSISTHINVTDSNGTILGVYGFSKNYNIPMLKIGTNVVLSVNDADYKNTTQSSGSATVIAGKILTLSLKGATSEYYKSVLVASFGDGGQSSATIILSNGAAEYSFGIKNSPTFSVPTIRDRVLTSVTFSFQNSSGVKQYFNYGSENTPRNELTITYNNNGASLRFMNYWGISNLRFSGDAGSGYYYNSGSFNFTLDKINNEDITLPVRIKNTLVRSGSVIQYTAAPLSGLGQGVTNNLTVSSDSLYGYTINSTFVSVNRLTRISLNTSSVPTTMNLYKDWDSNGNLIYNSINFTVGHTNTDSRITYSESHNFSNASFTTSSSGNSVTITTKSGLQAGDSVIYTYKVGVVYQGTTIDTIEKSVTILVTDTNLPPFHMNSDSAYAANYVYVNGKAYYVKDLTEIYIRNLSNTFKFQPSNYTSATFTAQLNSTDSVSGELKGISPNYIPSLRYTQFPSAGAGINVSTKVVLNDNKKSSNTHTFTPTGKNVALTYNIFEITECSSVGLNDEMVIPVEIQYTLPNNLSTSELSNFYINLECIAYGSQTRTELPLDNTRIDISETKGTLTKNISLSFKDASVKEQFLSQNSNINFTITPRLYGPVGDANGNITTSIIHTYNPITNQSVSDSPDLALRKNSIAINRNPTEKMESVVEIALVNGQSSYITFFDSSKTSDGGQTAAILKSGNDILISCGTWK